MPGDLAQGKSDRRPVYRSEGRSRSVVLAVRKRASPVYGLILNEYRLQGAKPNGFPPEFEWGGLADGPDLGRRPHTPLAG